MKILTDIKMMNIKYQRKFWVKRGTAPEQYEVVITQKEYDDNPAAASKFEDAIENGIENNTHQEMVALVDHLIKVSGDKIKRIY